MSELDDLILAALRRVDDPCSVAQQRPLSIYDMGLVRDWEVTDGEVTIRMCVTSPSCQMAAHFLAAAEREVECIPGVRKATAFVDADFFWTPDRLSREGAASLARQRAWSRRRRPPVPVGGNPADPARLLAFVGPDSRPPGATR
jgi:metal-sulfur cluster biosynthetic enzyme